MAARVDRGPPPDPDHWTERGHQQAQGDHPHPARAAGEVAPDPVGLRPRRPSPAETRQIYIYIYIYTYIYIYVYIYIYIYIYVYIYIYMYIYIYIYVYIYICVCVYIYIYIYMPRSSVGRTRSTPAPGLGWMGLVTANGKLARTAGLPTSTPRTCWTTSSGTMRPIRRIGTRRWPCWLALCRGARRGLSRRPRRGPERSGCPRVPALRRSAGRRHRRHDLERLGLQHSVGQ